jgi:UDP-N-acetylmuramoyl-tripeptide--D-alanyl-D-alanine ligase
MRGESKMIKRALKDIQQMVNGTGLEATDEEVMIQGITINSREIAEGNLFIPINGERFNGHEFINSAIEQGAAATLWRVGEPNAPTSIPVIYVQDTLLALQALAKAYRNQLGLKVVGITGSNGKTSTKDIVASVLGTTYKVQKTQGNFNNHFGLPITILQVEEDTEVAVLEMGMSGFGEIELLSTIAEPDAVIVTNIGEAHMMELGSRDGIAKAKLEIVAGLKKNGVLVYNGDEPLLLERVAKMNDVTAVTFGEDAESDYYPISTELKADGTTFMINKAGDAPFFLNALGKHNVFNALAAMAVAESFDVPYEAMKDGLASLQLSKMRMEVSKASSGLTIINDAYNASPSAMKAALHFVHGLTGYGKKIVVLGDMLELGEQEVAFHEEIGAYIDVEAIDVVLTFGSLGESIAKTANARSHVQAYQEKQVLIDDLKKIVTGEDLVFVKASRGMKLEEVVEALKG